MTTAAELNDAMEFDHVVTVHADGSVTDGPAGLYAPEMYDDSVAEPWRLLTGYTGQYGYNGPTMHASEFVGGRLARDILAEPGHYVTIISHATTDDENDDDVAGWAIAYIPTDSNGGTE